MKLTTRTEYSVQMLLQIARLTGEGQLACGREIAQQQDLTEAYLDQIMIVLKKAGFVESVRGRNGGYRLAKPASSISLLDIIEVIEGPLDIGAASSAALVSREKEAVRSTWTVLNDQLRQSVAGIRLSDIIETHMDPKPDYII